MPFKLSDIATIFIAANSHTLQVRVSHLYVRVENFELTATGMPIDDYFPCLIQSSQVSCIKSETHTNEFKVTLSP